MPNEPPKSRPEPPAQPSPSKPAHPQPESGVYGSQWGQSGKQNPDDAAKADPRTGPAPGQGG